MKQHIFRILLILTVSLSAIAQGVKPNPVNGKWRPVKEEIGGSDIPAAAFAAQELTISDSTYTMVAESTDRGTLSYKNGKMDIYGKDGVNAGKHFTAIYKFEKNKLTVCYDLMGNTYPATFSTKGQQMYFMCVFERQ